MKYIISLLLIILLAVCCFGQEKEPIALGEVTVTAKNILTTADKLIIIPPTQIEEHSFDGYTMMSLMNIPGLKVDVFENTITSNDGNAVMLCINGVVASKEEILALNPKSVKKIDYYTNFDPRHPEANRVLDFIVKTRESGGEVMVRANLHLNLWEGDDMAYWKLFSGNTEFAFSVNDEYKKYRNGIGSIEQTAMKFPTAEIIKYSKSLPSLQRANEVGGSATVLHRFTNALFKAGVSLNNSHTKDEEGSRIAYTGVDLPDNESHTYTHKDQTATNLKLQYDQGFSNQSILSFSIKGGYTHTDGQRDYASLDRFDSNTREKYYTLNPNLTYTMRFMDKKLSVFAKLNHFYTRSDQDYTENGEVANQIFKDNETIIELGANIKFIRNLSATVRLQDRILYKSSTGFNEKSNQQKFTPSLVLSYRLPNGDQLSTFWTSGLFSPSLSYFSTAEKRLNDFMVIVGNPNLRLEGILVGRLSYSHYFSWGSISPELMLTRKFHPVYQTYIYDAERWLYRMTYLNGGNSTSFEPHVYTYVAVVPNRFNIWLDVKYKYRQINTYARITKQNVTGEAGLTYMGNGLSAQATCSLPWKQLTEDGIYIKRPVELKLDLSYVYKDWSFAVMAKNPLYKVKVAYTYSLPNGFNEHNSSWFPRSAYNYFEARIGYRFSYGKKHKFQNVDVDTRGGSAILGF